MDFNYFVNGLTGFIWGLLSEWIVFTCIYLTLGLDFLSFRILPYAFKIVWGSLRQTFSPDEGQVGPLLNLMATSGAMFSIGNFTFLAGAILLAGPGVILWSCLSNFVGLAIHFTEAFLCAHYRIKNSRQEWVGGPMYYLLKKMPVGLKWLGGFFAVFMMLTMFAIGSLAQTHSTSHALNLVAHVPLAFSAVVIAIITSIVIAGGLLRISRFCLLLIPWSILLFILICLVYIGLHFDQLPAAFSLIYEDALKPQSAVGGVSSLLMAEGIRLGVFVNGAGLGRSVIIQSSASPGNPFYQACLSLVVSFIELLAVPLMAVVIVMSGSYLVSSDPVSIIGNSFDWGLQGSSWLFFLLAIPFALTTIVTYSFIGERCFEFIFHAKYRSVYRFLWIGSIVLSVFIPASSIAQLIALVVTLACLPNLLGLIILSPFFFKTVHASRQDFFRLNSEPSLPELS